MEDNRQLMETVSGLQACIIHNLIPILASVILIDGRAALITGEPGAPLPV